MECNWPADYGGAREDLQQVGKEHGHARPQVPGTIVQAGGQDQHPLRR